jgi:hypothetical protein
VVVCGGLVMRWTTRGDCLARERAVDVRSVEVWSMAMGAVVFLPAWWLRSVMGVWTKMAMQLFGSAAGWRRWFVCGCWAVGSGGWATVVIGLKGGFGDGGKWRWRLALKAVGSAAGEMLGSCLQTRQNKG